MADADKAAAWLAREVCPKERQVDRVRHELLTYLKQDSVEPPTRERVRRIVASGIRQGFR